MIDLIIKKFEDPDESEILKKESLKYYIYQI